MTCPLLKDRTGSGAPPGAVLAHMEVNLRQWAAQATQCIVRTDNYFDTSSSSATTFCTGPGGCVLNLPAAITTFGTYILQCKMTPWSRMTAIFYRERASTDPD